MILRDTPEYIFLLCDTHARDERREGKKKVISMSHSGTQYHALMSVVTYLYPISVQTGIYKQHGRVVVPTRHQALVFYTLILTLSLYPNPREHGAGARTSADRLRKGRVGDAAPCHKAGKAGKGA